MITSLILGWVHQKEKGTQQLNIFKGFSKISKLFFHIPIKPQLIARFSPKIANNTFISSRNRKQPLYFLWTAIDFTIIFLSC
jgi:hypothetical protein|tara:strand:+ start:1394 stop:1639 length:246 start_codon:yes stop_codon:yes gene_type:complete